MNNSAYYWWKSKPENQASDIFQYVRSLDQEQTYRQQDNFRYMRLYGSQELFSMRGYRAPAAEATTPLANRVTMNIIQSMIDTVVSKIGKNRPKPSFLTEGGNWSEQNRAQKLSKFVEGQFQACDFYSKAAIAFLDSCIFGTGCIKIFKHKGEIKCERVFIDEIKVDDREALYGEPRQLHQEKYIHKDVLKEMFPGDVVYIDAASVDAQASETNRSGHSDMLMVVESWHLPSGEDAKDGLHTISIENKVLFSEPYTKSYFPFVFWRWGIRPLGFFGQGLAEQLQGLQLEINKILRTIQVSMHLVSVPKIFIEASSKVVSAHLDNRIGSVIKYAGVKPEAGQLGAIPPELFDHLDRLYQRAYEIAGISQLSANAMKPAGLESGKALREYNDLETERFMSVAQRYEQVFMQAPRIMIDLAKEINEEMKDEGGYKIKVKGKKFFKSLKWKEVDLDEDRYVMGLFPTSALSSNPASRLEDVQDLIAAGFVSREDAFKLLDFPDLQSFYNYETAPGEDMDMVIEKIVDDGEYMTPEPYQNLEYGIQKIQKAYLLFRSQGLPEEKLELMRRWIEDANALIQKAAREAEVQMQLSQGMTSAAAAEEAAMQMPPVEEEIAADPALTTPPIA